MPQPVNIPANLQFSTAGLNQSTRQVQQALGRITGQASEFQKSLDASTARVFAFGATTSVLQAVNQSFKKLVSTTIEVEKRLIEINSIFQASASEFNKFRNSIFQVAKDTGQAFSTVAEGAAELARQGLSAEETATRLEAALILTRISGLDAEKSVKSLTAAINGFASAGLSAEQIVNKMVAVDTAFAVSAQDLADGFARAGSTAEDAGVSFDELLGLITAVEQRTARGGAVIGNAFKSIFTRLSRGKTIDQLKELGVQIDANQTGIQKLQALSAALEEISDPTVASQIKELAGGVFQINVVSSTLKDLSSETSIFAGAAQVAANATNEAFEKNALLNQSIAAQINSLVASLTSFGEKVGQLTIAPLLGNLVTIATKVSEAFDKALDPEKGNKFIQGIFKAVGAFISGPGLVLITTAFLKITMLVAKFAKEGFEAVLRIGSAQEKQAQVQSGIVGLLQRDAQLRKVLNSSTATQAQKEQAVIQAIQRENQLLQQQQSLLQNIVGLAARRGVAGYTPSGGFTGRRGSRFASGFQAEEATAMMLGATSGVKAKYGKGTIGGRKFIMNDQEMEITNFGRNGDSAVIPKYAKGFIPNFAQLPLSMLKSKVMPLQNKLAKGKKISESDKALIKEYEARAASAKKSAAKQMVIPQSIMQNYGYLVPQIGYSGLTKNRVIDKVKYGGGSRIYGLQKDQISSVSDKEEDGLTRRIKRDMYRNTRVWVNKLKPLGRSISNSEVESGFNNIKGAKGAIGAAVGSAFEVGITKALDYQAASAEGGDFDIRGGDQTLLRRLFGYPQRIQLADFKNRYSSANEKSFYKKILKEEKIKGRLKASGHVPNFNSMNKGVPVSQIRAHFDPSGNPIAVTNTRDEPNGLKDAIGREKKGIGMYAGGFVPNFAAGPLLGAGRAILGGLRNPRKALQGSQRDKASDLASQRKAQADRLKLLRKDNQLIKDKIKQGKNSAAIQKVLANNEKALSKAQKEATKLTKQRNKMRSNKGMGMSKGGVGGFFALQMAGQMAMVGEGDTVAGVDKRQVGDIINYAAMGSAIAGPVGAAVGSAVGSVVGAIRQFQETKDAQESKDKTIKDINKRIVTQQQTVLSKRSKSVFSDLKGLASEESMALAQEMQRLEKIIKSSSSTMSEVDKAAAKYKDVVNQAEKNMGTFKEIKELRHQINKLNYAIETKTLEIEQLRLDNISAAQEAERRIGIIRGIQSPNLTGVSKNIVDRGLQGEAAIASAQTAKQQDADLRRRLSQEKAGLDPTRDKDRIAEIKKELDDSAKNLAEKTDAAAVSLYNNLTAAGEDLKESLKKLAEQQSEAFDKRLEFASSLKGKQILPSTVIDNINALKNAKTAEERLAAAQRLAENRADLDAVNPAIFKGILASQGMTPEQQEELTRKVVEDAVRKSLEGSGLKGQELENVVQGIVDAQKEAEPDMGQTKTDIANLNKEIAKTEMRIAEFGEAFNAEGINAAIAKIGESLDAFAQGTLDATQILSAFQTINTKAEGIIRENNKRMDILENEIKTANAERKSLEATVGQLKQKIES